MDAYAAILILLGTAVSLIGIAYGAVWVMTANRRPRERPAYVSGKKPKEHAISRYHVRWYLVGLLFLAFDMEMVFMYPWAVVFAEIGLMAMVEMGMFLMILLVGVLYAWREGAFRWT